MGTLNYGSEIYAFDDRDLAHISSAIESSINRDITFTFRFMSVSGVASLTLGPGIPLSFHFDTLTDGATLDDEWIAFMETRIRDTKLLLYQPEVTG